MLYLQGEGVEAFVKEIFNEVPGVGQFIGTEAGICNHGQRAQGPHFDCWFPTLTAANEVLERLIEKGAQAVSKEWIQLERIAAGYPAIPSELGPRDLPGEAGLVGGLVCTTKGCFLGQESVLRMYNLGRARRGLHAVSGTGEIPSLPLQLSVEADERSAGELRSAYLTASGWTGVAMLKLDRIAAGIQCDGKALTVDHEMGAAQ
jgi:folate-binding protein YgfZ